MLEPTRRLPRGTWAVWILQETASTPTGDPSLPAHPYREPTRLRLLRFLCLNPAMPIRKSLLLALAAVPILGLIDLMGDGVYERAERSANAVASASSLPPYVRRGDEVEARYRAYRGRLERFYETLSTRVAPEAPDLHPKLKAEPPKPVPRGYQILPRLAPDAPRPAGRSRPRSRWYSWPWTERLIEGEILKIEGLRAELERVPTLTPAERRAAYEKMLADYRQLIVSQRTIDSHIQYNRLWQRAIADNRPGFDRVTALHDAVLERQAILDALSATDDAAFRKALSGIKGVDSAKGREVLAADLREREKTLAREIHLATDRIEPRPFLHLERPTPRRWVVRVPIYTDIDDGDFVQSFKTAIERVWHLRDGDGEFSVQLSITHVPAAQLYRERSECGQSHARCIPPHKGEQIDVPQHVVLFPEGGAVLTTGAISTHVTGRAIALGPHDIAPHVLAHEFGHILGFRDVYFRGYQDLGADGYQVMEVVADPDDIMGAPGTGPVLRRHFEKIIGDGAAPTSAGPPDDGESPRRE